MLTTDIREWLKNRPHIDTIIICGLETHVCINATTIDLLTEDYNVSTQYNKLYSHTNIY